MGSYQGQAMLVLADESTIEGQASIRTSKRSWEGTIVVGPEDAERASEVRRIELPTGESRQVSAGGVEQAPDAGTSVITFTSNDG